MTEPEDVWAEIARRAAVSRVSGVTADDDDLMTTADLREAQLNPNRQGGQSGVGGPGMMPPMMMGGMGGRGGGAEGGAGGGGGLGGGSMAAAAASTKPAQASTGLGVQAAQAPLAEEVPEEPAVPDLGGLGGGGGGIGAGGGAPEASAGAGSAPPADGFSADPVAVRGIASKWAELAQEIHALESPAFDAALGMVQPPERPQQAVNEQVRTWTTGAGEEFDALVARLHDVAGQYEAVEETGAAEIMKETADG